MKYNFTTILIVASALAILSLIGFQVSWIRHSQQLLEARFNQQVNMALCQTVTQLSESGSCSKQLESVGCNKSASAESCGQELDKMLASVEFDLVLREALRFYAIELPYEASIQTVVPASDPLPPYSCSLTPLTETDEHYIQLSFQDKADYILHQMGSMVGASVVILFFISMVFLLATYHLVRQQRMSRLNREFFNHMAHEFRTPLTNITLASRMMARKDPQVQGSHYLQIIQSECNHLMEQVDSVLHLARLDKKDHQLERSPVDPKQLWQEVAESMRLQIEAKSGQIEINTSSDDIRLLGDARHLRNAFRNLLDNALKYGSEKPRIYVYIEQNASNCRISIADNGPGLSAEDRHQVFEQFYRCQPGADAQAQKGFGLGLAYVRRIMELHHGQVSVNNHYASGTQFDLIFPN